MNKIVIKSLEELRDSVKEFIKLTEGKKVFAFYGAMGAGKTTFIKALCEELHVVDDISSPTFAIINEYLTEENDAIFHFDFYRLKTVKEAHDMGAEDYFFCGDRCLIEWPEIVEDLLPDDALRVDIMEKEKGVRELAFEL